MSLVQGGRKSPAFTGYRPQFHYDGEDWDAEHSYVGVERVAPGDTVTARLTFARPEYQRGRIYPGMPFEVREGARVIAKGEVTKLLGVEAEIRRLLRVAKHYLDEAEALAKDPSPEFLDLFSNRTMEEFAWLFRDDAPALTLEEDRCVQLVAHLDSAAIRLETIMECLFKDFGTSKSAVAWAKGYAKYFVIEQPIGSRTPGPISGWFKMNESTG